jgi:hypothetical protein
VRCRHVPDDATCRRFLDPKAYDLRRAADGVAAGRLMYDPAAAARCLDAGRQALCPALPFTDPSCAEVFRGLVPAGGVCATAFDCVAGATCAMPVCTGACCVGTCVPSTTGPPPAPRLAVGEPCVNHGDCVPDAYCDVDGRCRQMPSTAGAPCVFGCTFGDLTCDPETLRCVAYPVLGAPCAGAVGCNPTYAFCDGVCRARPGVGEPCDDVRRCTPATRCVGGACAARGGPGSACATDDDCDFACDRMAGQCAAYAVCPAALL